MTDETPKLMTDMNSRERARFVEAFKMLQSSGNELISALESEDDNKLAAPSLMFMLAFLQLKDLFDILGQAQYINIADIEGGVPPGFHPDEPEEEEE